MKKNTLYTYLLIAGSMVLHSTTKSFIQLPKLSKPHLHEIGHKIWHNECKNSIEKLTWWHENEQCASLGIGHFIWFPKNCSLEFTQTFPALLNFLASNGIQLPSWLHTKTQQAYCPWTSRQEFYKDFTSKRMIELRTLLTNTIELQTQFIILSFNAALMELANATPKKSHTYLKQQLYRLAQSPRGLYVLIDYVNFKGKGINTHERYNNQGWGLLQVLENMPTNNPKNAIKDFAQAAKKVLTNRVHNAPKERNEQKFLAGWLNRLNTY